MPLYRQCAISLDRPRFQLFGSLHLVVDGSNNDLLRALQECNVQMGAIGMSVGTAAKGWCEDGVGAKGVSASLPQCRRCS
jgi:hypothetical protein